MQKMVKGLVGVIALAAFAALVVFGFKLWQVRPWRVIASVNGHAITASELELRARTLMDDAKRTEHIFIPKGREEQALKNFRRQATQMWIMKEVLLSEALARGHEVTPADEKESLAQAAARLKSRNLTTEQFFKEGPIPEDLKRRDFREGVLINKFTGVEVRDKINVTGEEIDLWHAQLQRGALIAAKQKNEKPATVTRKQAIDSLRAQRFREGFRRLFRNLFPKAQVKCPEYPEMETVEGISPTREEDLAPSKPTPTGTTGVPPVAKATSTGTTGVPPVAKATPTGTTGVPPVAKATPTGTTGVPPVATNAPVKKATK